MQKILYFFLFFAFANHISAQSPHGDALKLDCAACHDPTGWTSLNETLLFNHDTTNFPLTGIHQVTNCKECHSSLVFSESSSQCIACHSDVHSMSVGSDCARCHSPQSWLVDHIPELHEESGFPLFGSHSNLSCVDCHTSETNLRFDKIGNDCINCHMDEYAETSFPNHTSSGFSTNCMECHDPFTPGWDSENLNHEFFPLILGHDIEDCSSCHTTNNLSDASPFCASCHMDDFNNTINPNHVTSNFSTKCNVCHSIASWIPTVIDHSIYPLIGAHALIANDCIQCHNGNYINTPNTCVGCHMDDFNNTTNPNHVASQFSTNCKQCHNLNSWIPANFNHDGFPIYSGKHKDEWNQCTDCHTNAGNYSIFSCIDCHEHNNQAQVNLDHNGVNNYSYNSNACFACHPNGKE